VDQEQIDTELEVQRALHKLAEEKPRLLQILMQMEQHYRQKKNSMLSTL
jgi:hypothetical protein